MATLRYIINDVAEILKQYSDDSNIAQEHIAYNVHITRAMLIQQKYSSRGNIIPQKLRQHFYHTLELSEENEFSAGLGTILRTVDPIVLPLEPFNFKSNIKISTGSYLDPYFSFVLPERFPYVGRNKWNQNQIYVTIGSDFRLYFTSANPKVKMIENVKLSYVTENPEEAYPTTIDYNSSLDFWDVEYPLEGDLITQLTDVIIKKLGASMAVPEDKNNNADDA